MTVSTSSTTSVPESDLDRHAETQHVLGDMLGVIWQRSHQVHSHSLEVMESAYSALVAGALEPGLRRQAEREAHKLTGGLGSFGLPAASEAARQLEQFWRAHEGVTRPGQLEAAQIPGVLEFLRLETGRPLPDGSQTESGTPNTAMSAPPTEAQPGTPIDTVDIVLVEDDVPAAELLIAQFGTLGYQIRWFADGDTALAALAVPDPTLKARVILLDYDLPGSDGLSVLQQLRSHGVLNTTRVVMLTAAAEPKAVTRAINAGAHGYVAKPFRLSTLLEKIEECVDRTPALFVLGPLSNRA